MGLKLSLVERPVLTRKVGGSMPPSPTLVGHQ